MDWDQKKNLINLTRDEIFHDTVHYGKEEGLNPFSRYYFCVSRLTATSHMRHP
jgi:hypothetical protein